MFDTSASAMGLIQIHVPLEQLLRVEEKPLYCFVPSDYHTVIYRRSISKQAQNIFQKYLNFLLHYAGLFLSHVTCLGNLTTTNLDRRLHFMTN